MNMCPNIMASVAQGLHVAFKTFLYKSNIFSTSYCF